MKENSITINRKDNTPVTVSVLIVDWLPISIKGLAIEDSDTEYTILLNGELSKDMLYSSFTHELEHIFYNDFHSDLSANEIERLRHHEVRGHNMRPPKERVITNDLEKDYYTIYEVAELLGFHHNTIRRMIKRGDLKAKQFNNREWRIKKADLEAFTE